MKVRRVKVHSPALRAEVMKSGGLVSLLESESQAAAARCNAIAEKPHGRIGDLYRGFASIHSNTAVGVVASVGAAGLKDDAENNTLHRGTGW